ncbi:MAG: hypothetical protein ACI4DP_04185, partial [Candidatus Ornithomonoglobus sp.]
MKKLLTSLLAAALAVQCGAVCSFAASTVTVGEKQNLCSEDFSGENPLSTWTVVNGSEGYADNAASASIVTDVNNYDLVAPYLKISNPTSNAMANTVTATKSFTVPSTGLVRVSFKYSSDHGAANADLRLTDDNGNGIVIGSGAEGINVPSKIVDGEEQTSKGSEDNRVFANTYSNGSWATSYAVGDAYTFDLGSTGWGKYWRNIEVVANTSSEGVNTTIAGQSITLGSGVYAVALTATAGSETTNILKGYLPTMGDFSKFTVMSKGWIADGKETRLDDLSVDFEPVTLVDTSYLELPINDTFDGTAGTLPAGWTSNLSENSDTRYVKVSNDAMLENTSHLRIHKEGENDWNEIQADRTFELPAEGGLININFDYLTANAQKGYGKKILLMSGTTEAVIVEHKYVTDNNVVLTDKDGTDSVNWPATVLGNEEIAWRNFNFTINCSNAELGGLGAGEYVVSLDNGEAVKGKLRGGVETLDKIRFTSDVGISSDVCVDNLKITKAGFESNSTYDVEMTKPETGSTDEIITDEGTTYNVGYTAEVKGAFSSVIIEKKYGIVKGLPLNVDLSANEGTIIFGLQINGLTAEDE